MRRSALLAILVLALGVACTGYPRDPQGTLREARGGVLRVGATEADPWLTRAGDGPAGPEAELIRGFAETIQADVEWIWGTQQEHFEALTRFELALAAGGLRADAPWSADVGLTRPYLEERWVVGVPAGVEPPADLTGVEVAVPAAGAVGAWAEEAGARAVEMRGLADAVGPVAAPEWWLRAHGFQPTNHEVRTVRRVFAIPPGENALLVALERYLDERRLARGRAGTTR